MTSLILLKDFLETQIEIWRPISNVYGYDVSNLGRVRSWRTANGKRTKRWLNDAPVIIKSFCSAATRWYPKIQLRTVDSSWRTFRLQRLVAQEFLVNVDDLPHVAHCNYVRSDCRASNLYWSSAQSNLEHALKFGMATTQKLTHDDVRSIRSSGDRGRELSRQYQVSEGTISEIRSGKRYKFVEQDG